jgi:hypothetical protein
MNAANIRIDSCLNFNRERRKKKYAERKAATHRSVTNPPYDFVRKRMTRCNDNINEKKIRIMADLFLIIAPMFIGMIIVRKEDSVVGNAKKALTRF